MPKLRKSVPAYCLHKRSGRGVVRLAGRDVYLPGPYDSPESRAAYDAFVAGWLDNGRRLPGPLSEEADASAASEPDASLTIDELIVRFMEFARGYYRQRGEETSEVGNFRDALRPLHATFGPTPAREFGPKRLKAVRERMVGDGLTRQGINARVRRIVRMFKWAASEELVPADVYSALRTVSGLQRGRTPARETQPVRPVPDAFVEAVRPFVSRQVWAMIALQNLSGMRPNEVIGMRTCDLDTSGRVWAYRPAAHKMQYQGRDRTIHLGPRAIEVLRPWLRANLEEPLFQPREAEAERKAAMRAARKSPVQPSQRDRSKPDPEREPGDRFTTRSYGRAIRRACEVAEVPVWSPNRLRHSAATRVRKEFGLEASQVVLGHARADVTQVYAEPNERLAADVMLKMG